MLPAAIVPPFPVTIVASLAETLGDATNHVVIGIGNEELGQYEVTIRRYHGKSPAQLRDEEIAAVKAVVSGLLDVIEAGFPYADNHPAILVARDLLG